MTQRFMQKLVLAAVAALLFVVALPGWATYVSLYVQQPDYNGLYASQNDTAVFGLYAQAYDNFKLGSATTITAVEWAGGYYNPQSAGSISNWTVAFYADNAGQPGALISSFAFAGNGNEFFVRNDNLGDPVYFYTEFLNFSAAAGTIYWLSVVPTVPFPPQWGWTTSSQGDGVAWQSFFGMGTQIPSDLAFDLFTTQNVGTPEPGSLMLLGTGVMGIAAALRRKLGA
jgi:hypothetical protein